MVKDTFQLQGNAAALYEAQKVPAIFGPLADVTLDAVRLRDDDAILDLACGTGIVARKLRQRIGPAARIAGVDLNAGMIALARGLDDRYAQSCEWYVADVTALPFEDQTFSIAFCQQGIQFFPDQLAALGEARRVLRPGGRIVISVWAGVSDLFRELAGALRRHVGDEAAEQCLAPFDVDDMERLFEALLEAGFVAASSQLLTLQRRLDNGAAIEKEIMSNPVGPKVAAHGDAVMAEIVTEVCEALSHLRDGEGFAVPTKVSLIQAVAG